MRSIFLTSDQHYDDENARRWGHRPFDTVEEMNEAMVERWNAIVGKDDLVYHLGDFSVTDEGLEFASRLNGDIELIVGNHDLKRDPRQLRRAFSNIRHDPFSISVQDGDDEVLLWLCHYPLQRRFSIDERPCYCVTGHVHGLWRIARNMVNVGVENWNYAPISLEEVLNCRRCEMDGRWDANVYPDAPIDWQMEVSMKVKRDCEEPTLGILRDKVNADLPMEETDDYRRELAWKLSLGDVKWEVP